MRFCGRTPFAESMKNNGIDIATLENNHIGNYGIAGIKETESVLNEVGIKYARYDEPLVYQIKGSKLGIFAVNGVGSKIDRDDLQNRIRELKQKVDILIVCIHWGKEYTYFPTNAPGIAEDKPREVGHWMVEAGADLIIGNHPHWVQGVELYKEGFIVYAHGNFIFDQEWSRETKEGVVGSYVFSNNKLVDVNFTPIVIEDYARPRLALESEGERILEHMRDSSRDIADRN